MIPQKYYCTFLRRTTVQVIINEYCRFPICGGNETMFYNCF